MSERPGNPESPRSLASGARGHLQTLRISPDPLVPSRAEDSRRLPCHKTLDRFTVRSHASRSRSTLLHRTAVRRVDDALQMTGSFGAKRRRAKRSERGEVAWTHDEW